MNSFIKNQFAEFRQTVLANPLFYYRLQRFSIYTWFNLAWLFFVLLIVLCSIVRIIRFLEFLKLSNAYPVFQLEYLKDQLAYRWEYTLFPGIPEAIWFLVQYVAFSLLLLMFVLSTARDLWLWHKSRWDHPESVHVRMLPISPSQAQFALADLRFYALSACMIFCMTLTILPATNMRLYLKYQLLLDINIPQYTSSVIWLWIFFFASYRTIQFQKHHGINIFANPMFGRWLIALSLWIVFPFIVFQLGKSFFGELPNQYSAPEPYVSLFVSLTYFSTIAACLFLFVSCWTLKHKLYQQQEE